MNPLTAQGLFNNPEYSDLSVKYGGQEIYGHKMILCTRSDYFLKLCGPNSQFAERDQRTVELKDDEPESITAILKHIYTFEYNDLCPISTNLTSKTYDLETHLKIAATADKYLLNGLREEALLQARGCLTEAAAKGDVNALVQGLRILPGFYHLQTGLESFAKHLRNQNLHILITSVAFRSLVETDSVLLWELIGSLASLSKESKVGVCDNCAENYDADILYDEEDVAPCIGCNFYTNVRKHPVLKQSDIS